MFKYLVTYLIVTFHQTECPDYKPSTDKFGVTTWPQFHCAVLHMKSESENKSIEFNSRDSAFRFYNDAMKAYSKDILDVCCDSSGNEYKQHLIFGGLNQSHLDSIRIDSVKL